MNECKNLSKPRREIYYFSTAANFLFCYTNQFFFLGYEVITMIIVLVTTKEKSLGTNFNHENRMLVIRLELYN